MGRRKEEVRRIPDRVWNNLDKPAADVGVDVGGVELALGLCETRMGEWVIDGKGEVSLRKDDGQTVIVKVMVFRSDSEMRGYKERCLGEGESLENLYDRWAKEGLMVVNGGAKLERAKGTLRHQLERIRASS